MSAAERVPREGRHRAVRSDAGLSASEWEELRWAHERLEHPSLAARIANVVGRPVEMAVNLLPRRWGERVHETAELAISSALAVALSTMSELQTATAPSNVLHMGLGALSGAAGGFFGLPGFLTEVPFTTVLMLRSIADIARSQGEDLSQPEARVACVNVFAFGSRAAEDDAAETGYYELRLALALHFSTLAPSLAGRMAAEPTLPASVALMRAIAARFGIVVSDKAAAQMVPVFGAASGALVNSLFMHHFQDMAYGHFTLRRLERRHGALRIQAAYESLSGDGARHTGSMERW